MRATKNVSHDGLLSSMIRPKQVSITRLTSLLTFWRCRDDDEGRKQDRYAREARGPRAKNLTLTC